MVSIGDAIREIRQELQSVQLRAAHLTKALDSLLALGTTRDVALPRPKAARVPTGASKKTPPPSKPIASGARTPPGRRDVIGARDRSVLFALTKGAKATKDLSDVLPQESGQSAEQRRDALTNALTRLRVKEQIRLNADGAWELVK